MNRNNVRRPSFFGSVCSLFFLSSNQTFDNKQNEFDKIYKSKGIKILCDIKSWFYVKGTEIDFSNDLLAGGFKLNNPNANRTCGCGTSFSA